MTAHQNQPFYPTKLGITKHQLRIQVMQAMVDKKVETKELHKLTDKSVRILVLLDDATVQEFVDAHFNMVMQAAENGGQTFTEMVKKQQKLICDLVTKLDEKLVAVMQAT